MSNSNSIDVGDLETLSYARPGDLSDLIQSSRSFQDFKDKAEAAFIEHQLANS